MDVDVEDHKVADLFLIRNSCHGYMDGADLARCCLRDGDGSPEGLVVSGVMGEEVSYGGDVKLFKELSGFVAYAFDFGDGGGLVHCEYDSPSFMNSSSIVPYCDTSSRPQS